MYTEKYPWHTELMESVILVDAHDTAIGTADKQRAHREGLLHRAFSVFVFDARGRLLMQRRSADKYHSAGLWSNTVCSHPRPGETTRAAAGRRLREELGFECPLVHAFSFTYCVDLGALHEHELDHVYIGRWDGTPRPDPAEVAGWRFASTARITRLLARRPEVFTSWFPIAFAEMRRRGLPPASGVEPLLESRV